MYKKWIKYELQERQNYRYHAESQLTTGENRFG